MENTKQALSLLFLQIEKIESALNLAKRKVAEQNPISLSLAKRIDEYDKIVLKQKELAKDICRNIIAQNWNEVSRSAKLITGLAVMINDDLNSLLGELVPELRPVKMQSLHIN